MLMSIGKKILVLCLTNGKPSSHINRFFIKTYLLFHFIVQFLNSVHFFSFNLMNALNNIFAFFNFKCSWLLFLDFLSPLRSSKTIIITLRKIC